MVNGQQNGGAPNAAMLTSGFDPNSMSPASFKAGAATDQVRQYQQTLAGQSRANLQRLSGANNSGSPMITQQNGQFGQDEMYQNGQAAQMRQMQMPGSNGGMPPGVPATQGGALADYQMQLMLLEQQNKRRLLMARQEQESVTGTQTMNQPGLVPGMSPRQGSRNGNSPPGSDPARRGTPKLGQDGLPESNGNRGSPNPQGMEHNFRMSMTPQMFAQMQANAQQNGQMQNANGMNQSPGMPNGMSAETMNLMRQRAQMPANMVGQWNPNGPNQMMPNPMMQQMDQRQSMPPPQVPINGIANRNQPGSPAQAPAPPTPSQGNKANPKGKKETKETKKVSDVTDNPHDLAVNVHLENDKEEYKHHSCNTNSGRRAFRRCPTTHP